nr:uncharacterized protein LOC112427891 [Macaca nemestrina]
MEVIKYAEVVFSSSKWCWRSAVGFLLCVKSRISPPTAQVELMIPVSMRHQDFYLPTFLLSFNIIDQIILFLTQGCDRNHLVIKWWQISRNLPAFIHVFLAPLNLWLSLLYSFSVAPYQSILTPVKQGLKVLTSLL